MAPSPPCPDTGDIVLKQLARATLKPVAAAFDTARPPAAGITILIYHRVGADSGGQVDLDVAMFDDQMAELAAAGNVISLDQAVELLASGAAPRPRFGCHHVRRRHPRRRRLRASGARTPCIAHDAVSGNQFY